MNITYKEIIMDKNNDQIKFLWKFQLNYKRSNICIKIYQDIR